MSEYQTSSNIGHDLYAADATQEHTPGQIVMAEDKSSADLGVGEFIYAQANEAIDQYEAVLIDQADYGADLAVANGIGMFGVALTGLASGEWGWFQISGKATVLVASGFAAGNLVYLTATAGTVDDAAVAGDIVYGSQSLSAIATPVAGAAYVGLNRSFCQDA